MKLGPIDALAQSSAEAVGLEGLRMSLTLHAAGGLAILLAATLLAIYKPAGLTKAGQRRLGLERGPAPAWVKACWLAAAVLALIVLAMALTGDHGPGAHLHG